MNTTSLSFLDRLKAGNLADKDAQRIQQIYLPLVRIWISCISGLTESSVETDDLAQSVCVVLLEAGRDFERQRPGSFRKWLRKITRNRILTFWKAQKGRPATIGEAIEQLADPNSELSRLWDKEYQQHLWQKLREMAKPDFSPQTWEAFVRVALQGQAPADVAGELGTSLRTVIQAKSRVLHRLRTNSTTREPRWSASAAIPPRRTPCSKRPTN